MESDAQVSVRGDLLWKRRNLLLDMGAEEATAQDSRQSRLNHASEVATCLAPMSPWIYSSTCSVVTCVVRSDCHATSSFTVFPAPIVHRKSTSFPFFAVRLKQNAAHCNHPKLIHSSAFYSQCQTTLWHAAPIDKFKDSTRDPSSVNELKPFLLPSCGMCFSWQRSLAD